MCHKKRKWREWQQITWQKENFKQIKMKDQLFRDLNYQKKKVQSPCDDQGLIKAIRDSALDKRTLWMDEIKNYDHIFSDWINLDVNGQLPTFKIFELNLNEEGIEKN